MADAAQIASLLQQSKAAHQRYRDNGAKMQANGVGGVVLMPGNPVTARVALEEASRLRAEAHTADPEHSTPAWASEYLHEELTRFYAQELAK